MAGHGPQLNAWSCQVVLVASKVLRVLAIGNAAELLRGVMSLRLFVFVTYAVAGISFALTHRPWRSRRPLARWRLVRVGAHAVALVGSFALWSLGLQRVGVLHTVLFDHAELWTVCAVALCTRPGPMREQRAKGTALVGLGYALLAAGAFVWPWQPQQQSATGAPTSGAAFGIAALLLSALVNVARAHSVRKLVSEVGGHKRLHALGTCAGAVLWPALCLLPPPWPSVGLDSDGGGGGGSRQLGASSLLGACAGALVMVVGSYYADALAHTRMPPAQPERNSLYTSVAAALALDALGECRAWRSPCALGATALVLSGAHTLLRGEVPAAELGPLSGVLSAASGGGSIRLPLHARVSTAAGVDLATLSAQLRQLWARRTTRRLLVYLCINFAFTLVEASLGRSSHSLSLVSDACHMLLDCAALAIGLFGEVASRWQPSGEHTFGYARFEVVCALANAALLLLTALALAREACARVLLRAPAVDSSRLLPVAVTGLGVNLLGIFFFSEHHVHLTAADACGVCTTAGDAARAHSANMAAVLLHVAADALGSIGVIISSLLIRTLGWTLVVPSAPASPRALPPLLGSAGACLTSAPRRALPRSPGRGAQDPLCSMLISALIFASAWPLFAQSAAVLMQRTPYMLEGPRLDACLSAVRAVDGVEVRTRGGARRTTVALSARARRAPRMRAPRACLTRIPRARVRACAGGGRPRLLDAHAEP